MSLLTVLLSSLFFFSGFAAAGIYAPDCSLSWEWTFNSLGQNACTVAAFMMSTCNGGSFTINALPGPSYSYSGPSGSDDTDLCKCNTVAYSLLSACDACQGSEWISWAEYKYNCTNVLLPQLFPNPVPAGTSVPLWALIDVTVEGTWDPTLAAEVGDSPEGGPGTILCTCLCALCYACGRLNLQDPTDPITFPEIKFLSKHSD